MGMILKLKVNLCDLQNIVIHPVSETISMNNHWGFEDEEQVKVTIEHIYENPEPLKEEP